MKFQVPQFIDMEDKIFGPLSFKEFSYIAGSCGLAYLLYRYIPSVWIAFLFMAPVLAFGAALAFYRPNNKPFIEMVQSALIYFLGKKLYIWKKEKRILTPEELDALTKLNAQTNISAEKLSQNKLTNLNWNLDTQSGKKENEN